MGKNSWSEHDLKAKGFQIKDGKAVKIKTIGHPMQLSPELTNVIAVGNELQKFHGIQVTEAALDMALKLDKQRIGIFIPINTPSSKNSKRIVVSGATRKLRLMDSKLTKLYRYQTRSYYANAGISFKNLVTQMNLKKPYRVEMYFVRNSRRKFDFHNAIQVVADLMVEHLWIEDDNINEILISPPSTGLGYHVDKNNPGVIIILSKQ